MRIRNGYRALQLLIVVVFQIFLVSNVAYAAGPCADNGGALPKACTKEIRIWNNTPRPIWVILQGSIQKTDALNCTVAAKGGGDVWLQAAFGKTDKCYAVKHDYYIFINPNGGIPTGGFASVRLPWWSKRTADAADTYIDWWRGGRVIIFDDRVALNDSYSKLKGKAQVAFSAGSPIPDCNADMSGNKCNGLQIFQATPKATIGTQTPYQLNEYTFADVKKVEDNGTKGGEFIDFNQNYNVSNVDQVYLPLAIEPVRKPANIGYMGTTMAVGKFRRVLEAYTGVDTNPDNPVWPIYNNPMIDGHPLYPQAGIRVPSTQTVFNFYMNPFYFSGDGKIPQIIPATPPKLVADMMAQWTNCTASAPVRCPKPDAKIYKEVNATFLDSYKNYYKTCNNIPPFLEPASKSPLMPKLTAFLTYVYGWVPFNFACPNADLPTADQPPSGSRVPIDYMHVQYNYEDLSLSHNQWFNPYTQLIHGDPGAGGLAANAYAFSIDDHSSFLSNDGGSLPGGLIFAVGGDNGLPNKKQVPPPTPPFYKYFDFVVALGPPEAGGATWSKYGICSDAADVLFPGSDTGAYAFGIDPAVVKITNAHSCNITLTDSKNRTYRFAILQAKPPPGIWPPFKASAEKNFDPDVMACPNESGILPPDKWCAFTNELADPDQSPGIYSISTRGPLF